MGILTVGCRAIGAEELIVRERAGVTYVLLNRPEQRNALTPDLIDRLLAEIERVDADKDVAQPDRRFVETLVDKGLQKHHGMVETLLPIACRSAVVQRENLGAQMPRHGTDLLFAWFHLPVSEIG